MPNAIPPFGQTNGLKTPAYLQLSGSNGSSVITANKAVGPNQPNPMGYTLTLSVSSAGGFHNTVTVNPALVDLANTSFPTTPGVQLAVSSVAAAVSGSTTYTGTIIGGGSNAYAGFEFTFSGFVNGLNNGTFLCTASTATTLVVNNPSGAVDTTGHAQSLVGSATYYSYNGVLGSPSWYKPSPAPGYSGDVAIVTSPGGIITALHTGTAIIEVAYPTYDNTLGNTPLGQPDNKIYTQIVVTVIP